MGDALILRGTIKRGGVAGVDLAKTAAAADVLWAWVFCKAWAALVNPEMNQSSNYRLVQGTFNIENSGARCDDRQWQRGTPNGSARMTETHKRR